MRDAKTRLNERLQSLRNDGRVHLAEHPLHQAKMHRANDFLVLDRGLAKRAVPQQDLPIVSQRPCLRLKAYVVEHRHQITGGGVRIDRTTAAPRSARHLCEMTAPPHASRERLLGGPRSVRGEVVREDLGKQSVASLATAGAARTRGVQRTGAPGLLAALRCALNQASVDQAVEVEARSVRVQAGGGRDIGDAKRAASVLQQRKNTEPALPENLLLAAVADHRGHHSIFTYLLSRKWRTPLVISSKSAADRVRFSEDRYRGFRGDRMADDAVRLER